MSPFQIYTAFEKEIRQYKPEAKVNTSDTTYWLNKAVNEYVDNRYHEGITSEENKRALEALIVSDVTSTINASTNIANAYEATLPTDLRYCLSDELEITMNGIASRMPATDITYDKYTSKILDPYSEHNSRYGEAYPLKLTGNGAVNGKAIIVTDGKYTVTNYRINGYIKNPTLFTIASAATTTEYAQFNINSQNDIIELAVKMYLENESNPRYRTYTEGEIEK